MNKVKKFCMSLELYEHQNMALPILRNMEKNGKGGFLADHMGLGKTITMAMFLLINKLRDEYKTDLIVCPLSLIKQWKRELKRVYKTKGLKPKILIYHGDNRIILLKNNKKDLDFVLTTYNILGTDELSKNKWGRVVLDESHTIKNGTTKKVKCAEGAYKVSRKSRYNWCITGTPFNNSIKDIISQCKFIGTYPYNKKEWWDNEGKNKKELDKWREQFVLRRTKEHLLKPPIYHDIKIKPTKKETKFINKLRSNAQKKYDKWKESIGTKKIKLQGQILSLIQRLRIVSNSYYCGDENIEVDTITEENSKVHTMVEKLDVELFAEDNPSESIVVFSQFTSYLNLLERVIEERLVGVTVTQFTGSMSSKDRDIVVNDFITSTGPRILLVSLLAGGCGLNLLPCSKVFLSEPYYNPFLEKQAEERVHRIGQKHQVHIYRFYMINSVETWVNKVKDKKNYLASSLLNFISKDKVPVEFSFKDLSDLFSDLVGFVKEDKKIKIVENKSEEIAEEIVISSEDSLGIECSICSDDMNIIDCTNLACGHLFHTTCLNNWIKMKNTCPLCTRTVKFIS